MKKFFSPAPIEIEIEKIDGTKLPLKVGGITGATIAELNKIPLDSEKVLNLQMACIFGGKPDDYDDIDIRTAKEVLEYMTGLITNPTKA